MKWPLVPRSLDSGAHRSERWWFFGAASSRRAPASRFRLEVLEERLVLSGTPLDGPAPDPPGAPPAPAENTPPPDGPGQPPVNDPLDGAEIAEGETEVFVELPTKVEEGDTQINLDEFVIVDVSDYTLIQLIEIVEGPPRLRILFTAGASGSTTVTINAFTVGGGTNVNFNIDVEVPQPTGGQQSSLPELPGPVLNGEVGATIHKGGETQIGSTGILTQGVSLDPTQLVLTLQRLPEHGELTLRGSLLEVGDTFLLVDIEHGDLVYHHDGGGSTSDSFGYSFVDPAGIVRGIFDFPIHIAGPLTLSPLPNQTWKQGDGAFQLTLSVNGTDASDLEFAAEASSRLGALKEQYGLHVNGGYHFNINGIQEKWLAGADSQPFFLLPNGNLYRYLGTGNIYNSELIAEVGRAVYDDPTLLVNAQAQPAMVSLAGNQLIVAPNPGYVGSFEIAVTVQDGPHAVMQTLQVTITNEVPFLSTIAPIILNRGTAAVGVPLNFTDPDGDELQFELNVRPTLFDLRNEYQLGPVAAETSNTNGVTEKWLPGSHGRWFYLLPDGNLYRAPSNGDAFSGEFIAHVGAEVYANPQLLVNAPAKSPISVEVIDGELVVTPISGSVGPVLVDISVFDGAATVTQTVLIDVVNHAPVLAAIGTVTVSHNSDTVRIPLSATDPDGDAVDFQVQVYDQLAKLRLAHKLQPGVWNENIWGAGEKWITNNLGHWYFLLPDGSLYRYRNGGNITNSDLIAVLGTAVYNDPSKLLDPHANASATVFIDGNELVFQPTAGAIGDFVVQVTASDGLLSNTYLFTVHSVNDAPVLAPLTDIELSHNADAVRVPLSVADPDGDAVDLHVYVYDPLAQLRTEHQLMPGVWSENVRGVGEKWIASKVGHWYFLLPDGNLYRYSNTGDIFNSELIATVGTAVYEQPSQLLEADGSVPVMVTIDGNELIIQPTPGSTGAFVIDVTATDGIVSVGRSFSVQIVNRPPVLQQITLDSLLDGDIAPLDLFDPDGEAVSIAASIQTAAYEIAATLGLSLDGQLHENSLGMQEKWLRGASGEWYFVLPGGELYRSLNQSSDGNVLVANVGAEAYENPSLFIDRNAIGQFVALALVDRELHFQVLRSYDGPIRVRVQFSDGAHTGERVFVSSGATAAEPASSRTDPHLTASGPSDPDVQDSYDHLMDELEEETLATLLLENVV